jgi:hypothetical protein
MIADTRHRMKKGLAILTAALLPAGAHAQEPASSWPGLAPSGGVSTVYVVDDTGVETTGRLLRLNADSIVLLVDGAERQFDAARVRRIQRRGDSLRNGAIIGAVVGVGIGLLAGGIADCGRDDPGGGCPGTRVAALLVSTGVYAAVGAGIDALIQGRTTLYEAPPSPAPASRRPSAHAFSRAAVVNLRVRW